MKKIERKTAHKREYAKPQLRTIQISSGIQTLGIGCKLSDMQGPSAPLQPYCGISSGCYKVGS